MKPWSDPTRLLKFRRKLRPLSVSDKPSFEFHARLSQQLTEDAITASRRVSIKGTPLLVILNDDAGGKGRAFGRIMKKRLPGMRVFEFGPEDQAQGIRRQEDEFMIVAIFSETKAWKGGASGWLFNMIRFFRLRADLFVSFGSPYLLDPVKSVPGLFVYWDSSAAQTAVAALITGS